MGKRKGISEEIWKNMNKLLRKVRQIGTRIKSSLSKGMLVILFVSSLSFFVGAIFYMNSFSGYEIRSQSTTGIIVGHYPYHFWEITFFTLEVNPTLNTLDLVLWFDYESKGNYSAALTLPYRIHSIDTLTSTSDEGNWTWRNASSGSVVMVTLKVEEDPESIRSQRVSAKLNLKDQIADKIFEVRSVSLPFGGSFTSDVQEEWDNLKSIAPISPIGKSLNFSLHLVLPSSAMITAMTHSIERRDPAKENRQVLTFQLTSDHPFFIQYSVPSERHYRESNLFLSGILIGLSISGYMVIVEERLRKS